MSLYAQAQAIGSTAPRHVTQAIATAANKTGVNFNYLMQQASVESGFNPQAKAGSSSATGLYQFIDQTWLRMVKTYGADHGLGREAASITQKANGDYTVANKGLKAEILGLRKDPKAASLMAAELANENADYLRTRTGRMPNETDLYMAHFLGAGGAARFINAMDKNPSMAGADLFPDAASSNRSVFYKNGRALSLGQIYSRFADKFDNPVISEKSVAFANASPVVVSPVKASQTYARIPSPAFSAAPSSATAWLPDYANTPTTEAFNPLTALLSAPFKLFESLFG